MRASSCNVTFGNRLSDRRSINVFKIAPDRDPLSETRNARAEGPDLPLEEHGGRLALDAGVRGDDDLLDLAPRIGDPLQERRHVQLFGPDSVQG